MNIKKILFNIIIFILFLFPILILLLQSISQTWRFQSGNSFTFTLNAFQTFLSKSDIWDSTLISVGIVSGVLILNITIGISAGKALNKLSNKIKPFIEAFLMIPILVPVLAIAMGLHLFMIRIGLADTLIGVIIIHLVPTVPYSIRIFHNAYNQLGTSVLEQSTILGASPWHQFMTIELPLIKPAVRSVTFLTIVISLSQYAVTSIIGGGQIISLPMIFFPFLNTSNTSVLAAFSIWFALIPLVLYIIVEVILLMLPYSKIPWRNNR
ncbi:MULTISPECIES: ABC transporter permease [Staphylococcus]|uniref:ABC transporter permease n=1 Tax=Staphylococcus TaxID=1279 RepID=UPI000E6A85A7|nr:MULTISPECIES: ABC transporter permease subunit [Staphylococcus]MCE5008438.1 ABC transporter permease subunit [Staphylococcus equorum]MDU0440559.1 ABC transporter permease subunit [Staphylococcus haemolyticus]RIO43769.1 ABC transporter permease subunit [Staphylococcus nepalensis]